MILKVKRKKRGEEEGRRGARELSHPRPGQPALAVLVDDERRHRALLLRLPRPVVQPALEQPHLLAVGVAVRVRVTGLQGWLGPSSSSRRTSVKLAASSTAAAWAEASQTGRWAARHLSWQAQAGSGGDGGRRSQPAALPP